MRTLSKEQALSLLETTLREAEDISRDLKGYFRWETWARDVRIRTEAIFGSGSSQAAEILPKLNELLYQASYTDRTEWSGPVSAMLRSFHSEIRNLWSDEGLGLSIGLVDGGSKDEQVPTPRIESKEIFVVHGHDHGRMQALARFLEHLGLIPIVLHERASEGSTIIEKLERHANVAFAVVLLTPDDVGSTAGDKQNLRPRARQNVVLELGYFMGIIGRKRTCALIVDGVEVPSDYSGVVYIPIDEGGAWKFILARELRSAGLPVDLNKAL